MSTDRGKPNSTEGIRRRADELQFLGGRGMAEAQFLAAIADGTLPFDAIDDETLGRWIETCGANSVVDAFLEAGADLPVADERMTHSMSIGGSSGNTTKSVGKATAHPEEKSVLNFPRKRAKAGASWDDRLSWIAAAAAVILGIVVLWPVRTAKQPDLKIAQNSPSPARPSAANSGGADTSKTGAKSVTLPRASERQANSSASSGGHSRDEASAPASATPAPQTTAKEDNNPATPPATESDVGTKSPASEPAVADNSQPGSGAVAPSPAATAPTRTVAEANPVPPGSKTALGDLRGNEGDLHVVGAVPWTTASAPAMSAPAARSAASLRASANAHAIWHAPPGGTITAVNGAQLTAHANGKVADVRDAKHSMDIHHSLAGAVQISIRRADGSRLVAEPGRPSYVERRYSDNGHSFMVRSNYSHGRQYNLFYRDFYYNGVYLRAYAPKSYFAPGFYGWVYNPWAVPIAYDWGWTGAYWYAHYSYYFQPYAAYSSGAFWLADYVLSRDLETAFAAAQAGHRGEGPSDTEGDRPTLTPEVKQSIADEVKDQTALENAEAAQVAHSSTVDPGSSGIPRIIADVAAGHPHIFLAANELDLAEPSTGGECYVTDGDVLQLLMAPSRTALAANLVVRASKGGAECAPGSIVAVNLDDLQEMQNHLRENLDLGLKELWAKQGKHGLPLAPPSTQAEPTEPPYVAAAPPSGTNDAAEIQQAFGQGSQFEHELIAGGALDSVTRSVPGTKTPTTRAWAGNAATTAAKKANPAKPAPAASTEKPHTN